MSTPAIEPADQPLDDAMFIASDHHYVVIPDWIIRSRDALSSEAVHTYTVLAVYMDGGPFPGDIKLAHQMNKSLWSVRRSLAELVKFGALRRTVTDSGADYALIVTPETKGGK